MNRRKLVVISSGVVILLLASFFVGTLFSSQIAEGTDPQATSALRIEIPPVHSEDSEQKTTVQERLVVYNARLSLETSSIEGTIAKIRALTQSYMGYVSSSSRSNRGMQSIAEIVIRVPEGRFHAAVQEIEAFGKVLDERSTSDDITQQYIDLKARLGNLQKQEQRLQEILSVAKTVDEILRVESELSRARGEIESLQGRINYLERNAEMALISIVLTEPAPPFSPPGMDWGDTLEVAIWGLFSVARGLIVISVSLLPLAAIGAPAYYIYRRRVTKKKN